MIDHCIMCGGYVPEGRQVCIDCERRAEDGKTMDGSGERVSKTVLPNQSGAGYCRYTWTE